MIVGVQYAMLLGVITAVLNLIPYIGILCAGIIAIVASLTNSGETSVVIGIIIANSIVQLIDNNILVPKIVASKVKVNAIASIVGVILGGSIAGVAGMFLAIPIMAILKVAFDRIPAFHAWGLLMSDDAPKTFEWYKTKHPDTKSVHTPGRKSD